MSLGWSTSTGDRNGRIAGLWGRMVAALGVALVLAGCIHQYAVPNGGPESKYSPPAFQGRITAVGAQQLTVMTDGGETVELDTPAETKYIKLAGGLVLRQELMAGQRVRVWYQSAKPKPDAPKYAAVVMLASLDPADDWPKGQPQP